MFQCCQLGRPTMTANGLALGDGGELEAQMFNKSTKVC